MPCQQSLPWKRPQKAEVDGLLRQERERTVSNPSVQRTFSFLKPESLRQRFVGEVISRLEKKGFVFKELRLHHVSRAEAEKLYGVHRDKPFFGELVDHVTSGPVVLMVLEGPDAVDTVRRMVGATNPLTAEPGTIRGDLSTSITANIIHASDSRENAEREASIFFKDAI